MNIKKQLKLVEEESYNSTKRAVELVRDNYTRIIEQNEKSKGNVVIKTLSSDEIQHIENTTMDPKYDYLNSELE